MKNFATPWLVTMSLLGINHIVNSASPPQLSQDLEAPFLSKPETSTSNFNSVSVLLLLNRSKGTLNEFTLITISKQLR